MSGPQKDYSTIIIDIGSGITKAGFAGENGPRCIFNSIVGTPKMPALMVGMEQQERYVGDEAIAKLDIMNFQSPVQRGQVADWDKFETLLNYSFYSQMKIVPEEISVLITESPLSSKENRRGIAEMLFEKFNVVKIHIANSSMLGLYSYGKTCGLVVDSGFNVTSSVPVYEGYPLPHASTKIDIGGEDISKNLLDMIKGSLDSSYKLIKGRLLADNIKETYGYLSLNKGGEDCKKYTYTLPDGKTIELSNELCKSSEVLFSVDMAEVEGEAEKEEEPEGEAEGEKEGEGKEEAKEENKEQVKGEEKDETEEKSEMEKKVEIKESESKGNVIGMKHLTVTDCIINSIKRCDSDIEADIKESICLIGGNTLLNGFPQRLKNELSIAKDGGNFNISISSERQFSSWIGGSIFASLGNFSYLWVTKQDYDECGKSLEAIDSKCF